MTQRAVTSVRLGGVATHGGHRRCRCSLLCTKAFHMRSSNRHLWQRVARRRGHPELNARVMLCKPRGRDANTLARWCTDQSAHKSLPHSRLLNRSEHVRVRAWQGPENGVVPVSVGQLPASMAPPVFCSGCLCNCCTMLANMFFSSVLQFPNFCC